MRDVRWVTNTLFTSNAQLATIFYGYQNRTQQMKYSKTSANIIFCRLDEIAIELSYKNNDGNEDNYH